MKIVITGWSKAERECKNCTAYNKKKKEKKSEKKKNRKKNFKGKYKKEKEKKKIVPGSFNNKAVAAQKDGAHQPPTLESNPAGPFPSDQLSKIGKLISLIHIKSRCFKQLFLSWALGWINLCASALRTIPRFTKPCRSFA